MRLFISDDCWEHLLDLPKNIQLRVKDFQRKFKENPYGHNINLEKIVSFKDNNLRTARVTNEYRAIIGVLPGDEYCLLYIDHHDEAMDWAANKKFVWNEFVSSFQIVPVVQAASQKIPQVEIQSQYLPFAQYSDEQLLKIGVPGEFLSLVRSIKDIEDLDANEKKLPSDIFEHLFYLLDGAVDINEIISEIEEGKAAELNSANNKRRFIEITNDEELDRMIDGDIEKWQIFLHPSQRIVVESKYKGSVKISGGAGSGKTVAALHRLKKLSENAPANSILFTTFTNALVTNIKQRIVNLGVNQLSCRISNIDEVARSLAKQYGVITDEVVDLNFTNGKKLWEEIVDENMTEFSPEFLYQEYLDVIAYNNLKSERDYMHQSRIGRGTSLSPKKRKEIWSLVEIYRERKAETGYIDRSDLFNKLTDFLRHENLFPYQHVIADEIQDFSNPELRLLRALVKEGEDDLFMVGDPYQRIYNNKGVNFSSVGINVRGKRSRRLRVNYRTTEEIKRSAVSLVKGIDYDNFDGEKESLSGYVSLLSGPKPEYKVADSKEEEYNNILSFINECIEAGIKYKEIAIACYFKDSLKSYQSLLHNSKIPYQNLAGNGICDKDGIVLSTLHNMKGLEFKSVIIADVNDSTYRFVPANMDQTDKVLMNSFEKSKRSLYYVAITRAMQRVLIVGTGTPCSLMENLIV
jgi:mRNA-degrading endonuclease RelE of RelBE toxin-antitoxin system